MIKTPGLLGASRSKQFQCENCSLLFDSQKALQNHQAKFCTNPKYNDLDELERQFQEKSKGRDISLYGKPSMLNINNNKTLPQDLNSLAKDSQLLGINSVFKNNNPMILDKEYQSVLDQLTNKQSLKKKLERQKNQAYEELQMLQKKQNQAMIDLKHDELSQVLKRRKQLQEDEKRIQEEMVQFQRKKKEMEKNIQIIDREDYIFKEARHAGKLAKQREILEEKKKEMEHNLNKKRKQRAHIEHILSQSKVSENQVYIPPNFRKNKEQSKNSNRKVIAASNPVLKTPQDSLDSLSFQNTKRGSLANNNDPFSNPYSSVGPASYAKQNVGIQHWPNEPPQQSLQLSKSNQFSSPLQRSTAEIFNLPHQKFNNPLNPHPQPQDSNYPYFTPQNFSKNQKLLTDLVNRNGKSEQDLFIEMLNAQEYDSLNLLAKIPKGSELYQVKLQQYKELSKLRDEYKKQAHEKRVQKMKREFEYEKKIVEKEMQNALWVDENRKMMLAQQINIVQNQELWQRDKELLNQQAMMQRNSNPQPFQNMMSNPTPPSNNRQMNNNTNLTNNQPTNPNPTSIPSIQNIPNQPPQNPYQTYLANLQNNYSSQKIPKQNQATSLPSYNLLTNQNVTNPNRQSTQQRVSQNANQLQNYKPVTHNSQTLRVPDQDYMWGYKVRITMMRNYTRSKPVKIRLVVKQHDITNTQPQSSLLNYEFSTSYHFQKVPPQSTSHNPNINNKFDINYNVVFKQDFTIPLNLQEIYNKKQNEIYLFLFAMEKDETKLSNQPSNYAWYNMKLTHFGQIKEGIFTVNLYTDQSTYPLPSDMNKKRNKIKEEIVFELNQVLVQKEKPPVPQVMTQQGPYQPPQVVKMGANSQSIANQSQYSNAVSKRSNKTPSNATMSNNNVPFKQQNSQTSIINQMSNTLQSNQKNPQRNSKTQPTAAFIPNEMEAQFVDTSNKQPKNIDIVVGQLRTLPSYVGPIKIQLSFIDKDGTEVLPRQEILSDVGSNDMYNPLVSYVKMIRNEKLMNPTTILFIRFLALNSIDYEFYMLGFTVFYLFLDQNADPIVSNDKKDFLISTGYFQLPIFWGSCKPFYSKIQGITEKYPLIPCTSVLIGCVSNSSNKPSPIPKYSEKVYNTLLFNVQDVEVRLFEEQAKRQRLDSSKILGAYLKFKGFTENYTPQQAKNYFFKTMSFTKQNIANAFPLQYMAQYNKFFGIQFSLDKITIPQQKQNYYYFTTISLSPPGKYYASNMKDADELKIISDLNHQKSLKYELVYFGNKMNFEPKYDINTCLIIEFKRVKIGKENELGLIQNYAYVLVPLFKEIQEIKCVNVMKDTVNTYLGAFDPKDLKIMQQNLPQYLDNLVQTVKPSELQITFRLLNGYFTTQYSPDLLPEAKNRNSSYFSWYSRPIDIQDAKKKVKAMIQRKYEVAL